MRQGQIIALKTDGKKVWGTIDQDPGGKIEIQPVLLEDFKLDIGENVHYQLEIKPGLFGFSGTKYWAINIRILEP